MSKNKIKNYELKIKDSVDLKELEKFGFIFDNSDGIFRHTERNYQGSASIRIRSWDRRILFRQDVSTDTECLCVLYDLIQANLVEKVGKENG